MYSKAKELILNQTDRNFFLFAEVVFFLCFLPAYLGLFPGVFGFDAPSQLWQFEHPPLALHHPIIHTLLLGWIISGVHALGASYQVGLIIYILLQYVFSVSSLAYLFLWLKKRQCPFFLMLTAFIWTAISPFIQSLMFNATKDSFFAPCFVLFILVFSDALDQCREKDLDVRKTLLLIVTGLLLCAFRKQGIWVVVASWLVSAFLRLKNLRFYLSGAAIFFVFLLCNQFFTGVMGYAQGSPAEMLSVSIQQMGVVAHDALTEDGNTPPDISEKQLSEVIELLPIDVLKEPVSVRVADPYKNAFRIDRFLSQKGKYIRLWWELFLQNPGSYVRTFVRLVSPYFDIRLNDYRGLVFLNTGLPEWFETWDIREGWIIPAYRAYLIFMVTRLPYYPLILQPSLYIILLVVILVGCIVRKQKTVFLSVVPFLVYFGTNLLGPVALLRYQYPLLLGTPFLFWTAYRVWSGKRRKTED